MEVTYLLALNVIFLGVIVILFRSAKRLHDEVDHAKKFAALVLEFVEQDTNRTPTQVKNDVHEFIKNFLDEQRG